MEVKGLARSKAGTNITQKKTLPSRSNAPGKKGLMAAANQRSNPCKATAAAQNLKPRTKLRAEGRNAAKRILFIVLFSARSDCRSVGIAARWTPPYQHGVEQARY